MADQDPWQVQYSPPSAIPPSMIGQYPDLAGPEPIVIPQSAAAAAAPATPARDPWEVGYQKPAALAATPQASPEIGRLANIAAGASGLSLMKDTSMLFRGTFDRLIGEKDPYAPQTPEEREAAANLLTTGKGMAEAIKNWPAGAWSELSQSGEAMRRGDMAGAVGHLGFAIPFLGGAAKTVQDYLDRGDVSGGLAHGIGLVAGIALQHKLVGGELPEAGAVPEAGVGGGGGGGGAPASRLSAAISGGFQGAKAAVPAATEAALEKSIYGAFGGLGGMIAAGKVAAAKELGKGFIQGAREAWRGAGEVVPAAAEAVAPEAAAAAVTPGQAYAASAGIDWEQLSPTDRQTLEHVAQAQANVANQPPPAQTPVPPEAGATPLSETAVPPQPAPAARPEAAAPAPEISPAATEAPAAPETPKPAPAEIARQLEESMRVDRLTDYAVRKGIPADFMDELGPEEWKMIADDARTQPPTADQIAEIKANVAQQTAPITSAEAEQTFERSKYYYTTPEGIPVFRTREAEAAAQGLAEAMPEHAAPPPEPGEPAPTAAQQRMEALAQYLAPGDISSKELATIGESPESGLILEQLAQSLGHARPGPGELEQIVDRVRQLRGETPGPVDAVRQILNDPDKAANEALDRIRKRGGFEPGQTMNFGPGGDSFNDMVIWSAANLTKAAQKIYGGATDFAGWSKQMVADFGEAIRPHLQGIWDRAKPMADAAMQDVKRRSLQDMRIRIPDEERVVSPDPTRTIDGKPFHSLDLDKPGPGFMPMQLRGEEAANQEIQKAWRDSIQESEAPGGHSAADAVQQTGAKPPDAKFWDGSLKLPDRTRYWYELSGESFTGRHFDLPREQQPAVIDSVAATSGGAEPPDNMRRAIGLLAENAQRRPSMVDLRDPVSPRRALDPSTGAIESRKYGSFSGTMQRTSGLTTDNPLPTNDVQVGSMFGISGNDIGKNPILYEVLSRFFMKMRDMQNRGLIDMNQLPTGEWVSSGKPVQPYESWQMQASPWVYERARKDPSMSTRYDDYSQVMDRDILPRLQAAGIPTPGGKITNDTLMDPRTPDVMAPTAPHFRATPTATMEVATTLTPQGARARQNFEAISQLDPSIPWVREAKDQYARIQRQAMEDLGERYSTVDPETGQKVKNPSPISQLMSAMTGEKMDVSRINTKAAGTYQGQANPNMRIPLTGRTSAGWRSLDNVERDAFLAYLGKWLNQDASAGSHFKVVPEGTGDTYTAFLRTYADKLDIPAIEKFAKTLGFDVNAEQTPTGVTLDINIGGRDDRPTLDQVRNALAETFGNDPNVHEWRYYDRAYSSNSVPKEGYDEAIGTYEQREQAAKRAAKKAPQGQGPSESGAGAGPRTAFGNVSDIRRVGRQVQAISKARDAANDAWSANVETRLQKHLAKTARQ